MTAYSRRDFGRLVMAGLPTATLLKPGALRAASRTVVGLSGASVRDLRRIPGRDNLSDVIGVLRAVGVTSFELALANVEPAPPSVAPVMGGSAAYPRLIVLSPEEVAATNAQARAELRSWRVSTPAQSLDPFARKLSDAGLTVEACATTYEQSFTDEEIDASMRQARALGATVVSSPLTFAMAERLVPFAIRHEVGIAIHNQVDGNPAGAIATAQLADALALSPAFTLKLDIGNLTASNGDAVAQLRAHQARVSYVVVKDRLRNGGASQPFGEGDTPIADVLSLLAASSRRIPALIEYDYVGLHSMVDELTSLVEYVRRRA